MTRWRKITCVFLVTALGLWLWPASGNAAPSFSFGQCTSSAITVKNLSFDNEGHFKAVIKLGGNGGWAGDWSHIEATRDPSGDSLAKTGNYVRLEGTETSGYFEMGGTYEKGEDGKLHMRVTDGGGGEMKINTWLGSTLMDAKVQFTNIVMDPNPLNSGKGHYSMLFALNIDVGKVNNTIDSKILDAFDDIGTGVLGGVAKVKLKNHHGSYSGSGRYGGTAVACPVPEPQTWLLLTTMFVGIGLFVYRKQRRELLLRRVPVRVRRAIADTTISKNDWRTFHNI